MICGLWPEDAAFGQVVVMMVIKIMGDAA